jgi:phage terminase large subunit
MEATQYGHELYKMAIYIKKQTGEWPLIAVERSMGLGAIYVLQEYNYPNLFRMPTLGDAIESEEDNKIGWVTNKTTRMLAIDGLAIALRQRAIRIYDIQSVKELMTFIIGYNGKPQAANGAYDDNVMAMAIALKVAEISPKTKVSTKEEMMAKIKAFPQIERDEHSDTPV